jgi:hypothetical protein
MKRGLLIILGISSLPFFYGCGSPPPKERVVVHERTYVRSPTIVARQAPPRVVEEVIPPSPGRRYVWTPGYWVWDGRWLWQPGRWTLPPREHVAWVPGHWQEYRGEWHWVPGQWR